MDFLLPEERTHNGAREYCGLFGVWGVPDVARTVYFGLYSLQHRGQESAGMVTTNGERLFEHHGMGLVSEVFKPEAIARLPGHAAIAHTRYSTTGVSDLKNAQPIKFESKFGPIAIAHNGNLVNARALRKHQFENRGETIPGVVFLTSTDTEIIVHLVGRALVHKEGDIVAALKEALKAPQGAFSLLFLTPDALVGVRDPGGFRPLVLGKRGNAYALASETCAFEVTGFEFVRDIEPGELVIIHDKGVTSDRYLPKKICRPSFCLFEFVYFARPDSVINGDSVYEVRRRLGKQLAKEHPVRADLVTPVPDSGNHAALGFAQASGIPFEMALQRNHYIGRSFIQPYQDRRELDVKIKIAVVRHLVEGKRVVVIDDSIVRGTTVRSRITLLRQAGAKEVHLRVACPPIRHPCFYGIDFPTPSELVANQRQVEDIRKFIGADSLGYLSLEGMLSCMGKPADGYCTACWSGQYPVAVVDEASKYKLEA